MERTKHVFLPLLIKVLQDNQTGDVEKFFFIEESQLINARRIRYHHLKPIMK